MFNIEIIQKRKRGVWTDSLNTSLVSYWKLDESSGTRNDLTSANNLSPVNTPLSGVGKVKGALSLIAANTQYLDVASNSSLQTGDIDFSFAGWIYPRSISSGDNNIISKITLGQSVNFEYFLEVYGPATYHFRWRVGSGDLDNAEAAITLNNWLFFVCWHDSVANTINYQLNNGTVKTVAHSAGTTTNVQPFNIGAGVTTRYFDGMIDEIGFWKRVLTADERTLLWNNGYGTTKPY